MIIDAHVHLKHGDAQRTEYLAETIVRIMDEVGVGRSIVFAMSTTTRRSIEMAQDATRRFPDRLIPFVYALPHYGRAVVEELDEAISSLGFRGIKLHAGECTLAEYVTDPVIELAGQRGVPCLIDCIGQYNAIQRMAETFPETNLIVAHLGRYLCKDESLMDRFIALAETHTNVFLDVSGVVIPRKIREAVRRVGSKRVIFGTDGPHEAPDTVAYARTELDKIRRLKLDPEDEKAVLGGAIAELLLTDV